MKHFLIFENFLGFLVCCDESEPRSRCRRDAEEGKDHTSLYGSRGAAETPALHIPSDGDDKGGKLPHRAGRTKGSRLYLLFRFPVAIGGIKTPSTHGSISLLVVDRRREYGGKLPHRVQGTSMKFCTAISYLNATTLKKFVTFRAFRG